MKGLNRMNKPKFRAYVKSINKVLPVCELSFRDNDDLPIGVDGYEMWYRADEVILMQYTGYKSKNVEIYSGYIFKDPSRLEEYYFVVEWVFSGWQFVTYLKSGSKAKGISHGMNQGYLEEFDLDEMLLVGNVHANPELLNEVE